MRYSPVPFYKVRATGMQIQLHTCVDWVHYCHKKKNYVQSKMKIIAKGGNVTMLFLVSFLFNFFITFFSILFYEKCNTQLINRRHCIQLYKNKSELCTNFPIPRNDKLNFACRDWKDNKFSLRLSWFKNLHKRRQFLVTGVH